VWLTHILDNHDTVTVWDIESSNYNLPDALWSNQQRIVQYAAVPPCCTETWGGVTDTIDKDIEDGSIVAGNGVKAYGFTQEAIFQAPAGPSFSPMPPIYGIIGGLFPPIPDLSECTPGAPANGCVCPNNPNAIYPTPNNCQIIGRVLCAPTALEFYGIDPAICYNWTDPTTGGILTYFNVQLARAQCNAVYDWGLEGGGTVTGTLLDYINAWASGVQGGCELDGPFVCPINWEEFCANGSGPAPWVGSCPPEYNDPSDFDLEPGQDPNGQGPFCRIGLPPVCPSGSIYEPLLENCVPLAAAPPATYPTDIEGISDIALGGTLPPAGEIGQVVGFYTGSDGLNHGFLFNPNTGGITPSIDCNNTDNPQLTGPGNTQLTGINNAGLAVGYFQNASNTFTSFTLDTTTQGAQCQPVPCQGIQCWALGINDAKWIVGFQYQLPSGYPTLSGGYVGFVYKTQTNESLTMTPPFEPFTAITGVNGQGSITGYYSSDGQNYYGFTGDASQDTISIDGTQFPCGSNSVGFTIPSGIDNNEQIVGYSFGEFDSQYNSLSSFLVNGGFCNAAFADQYGWTYGLNDDVQIVGETFGLSSSPFVGFVLVPQH
jgi:hypothetical protein